MFVGICVMFVCIFASQIMDIGKVVLIGFTHVCLGVCLFSSSVRVVRQCDLFCFQFPQNVLRPHISFWPYCDTAQ